MTAFASGPPGYSPPALGDRPLVTLLPRPLLRAALVGLGLSLALGACGRRGPLEAPPNGRALPGDEAARPGTEVPGAITPLGRTRGSRQPIVPPKEPFILDPIL